MSSAECVQVYLRVRPLTQEETERGLRSLCEVDADGVSVTVSPPDPVELQAAVAECARDKTAFDLENEQARTPGRKPAVVTPRSTRARAKSMGAAV